MTYNERGSYNKAEFFKACPMVRKSSEQVQATEFIVDQWFHRFWHKPDSEAPDSSDSKAAGGDIRHLAYILATAYHETAGTMLPIREYGRGRGRKYGNATGSYHQVYYGRGYVQLTWLDNYIKATRELHKRELLNPGADLARTPDLALDQQIAADIMFLGMYEGWFTGKRLINYINKADTDFVHARKIINGMDKAHLLSMYANRFLSALKKSTDEKA